MKRIYIFFVFAVLIIFLLPSISGFLISGASQYNQEVYQAQKALQERGYNLGKPDGIWGHATERAVKYFQVDTGLPVTGQLDEQTKAKLGLRPPERGIQVQGKRLALVIGNGAYKASPLKNPPNDACDMASTLKRLGFEVIQHENASHKTMESAIRKFGKKLRKGGVGLFYFAGHGIQCNGNNYLIPIDAHIETEADVKFESVNAGRVLGYMEEADNNLNVVILDACRNNPFARSFRSTTRGLARMDAPKGTIIAYATSPGSVADDGEGRNGIYTKHLLKNIDRPGYTIQDVFMEAGLGVMEETMEKQVPWVSSTPVPRFYLSGKGVDVKEELSAERERLESERQELERLKAEIERKRLEKERKRLEEEKQKLEMAKLPPTPSLKEIARDGRFIAYDNGTVKDTQTGLVWADKDNGRNVTWQEAKEYCENYRGGGYTDWRMPTQDELAGLYDENESYQAKQQSHNVHLTELIELTTCCPWASDTRVSFGALFYFDNGSRFWFLKSYSYFYRALPVRSGN